MQGVQERAIPICMGRHWRMACVRFNRSHRSLLLFPLTPSQSTEQSDDHDTLHQLRRRNRGAWQKMVQAQLTEIDQGIAGIERQIADPKDDYSLAKSHKFTSDPIQRRQVVWTNSGGTFGTAASW